MSGDISLSLMLKNARSCQQAGHFSRAIEWLETALQHTINADIYNNLGTLHLKLQQSTLARRYFCKALRLTPEHQPARYNLASVHAEQMNWPKAIALFSHVLKRDPTMQAAHFNISICYNAIHHPEKTLEHLQQVIVLNPEHAKAHYTLANFYVHQCDYAKAKQHYQHTLRIVPTYAEAHYELAVLYLAEKNDSAAKHHLKHCLDTQPQHADAQYNLGYLYQQENDITLAQQHYEQAINADAQHFAAHYNLGRLFKAQNNHQQALSYFFIAHQINPSHQACHYLFTALSQGTPPLKAPDSHISTLFDDYAQHYDKHLNQTLHYQIPQYFKTLIATHCHTILAPVLDLGCGTGLCGDALSDSGQDFIGIDLSENMLAQAQKKGMYTELLHGDILSYLSQQGEQHFSLIVAGDVLCYFGCLAKLFALCRKRLKEPGYFLFSIEKSLETETYQLTPSGRYQHHPTYLEALVRDNDFYRLEVKSCCIRRQNNHSVDGLIYFLKTRP